jgi:2-polyprenyl-3-methyl-5-hydroxy-6-metoxy-1,4-benzoquinol methylase
LKGNGLEIGGLNNPLIIPKECTIKYLDIEEASDIKSSFIELNNINLVKTDYIGDVGKSNVMNITNTEFDFIIMNHVIEHVANPIQAIKNVWSGIKEGGQLVISVPDKNYTFDKDRPISTFEHILSDYYRGMTDVIDEHYIDFLSYVCPEVFSSSEKFTDALSSVRKRREHVHVWDSISFRNHLVRMLNILGVNYSIIFESSGDHNGIEYFAIIQKGKNEHLSGTALNILLAVYDSRLDLQKAFPKARENDIKELLKWATTSGTSIDSDRFIINMYKDEYGKLLNLQRKAI